MNAKSVGNFSHDRAGIDIEHFNLGSVRNVEPAGTFIDSEVVPTALTGDRNFLCYLIVGSRLT
jgi:hypothetical protein